VTAARGAVRIAVVGAGLNGRRHAGAVAACPATRLAAVVDPGPAADAVADRYGVPRYRSLAELLERDRPIAAVVRGEVAPLCSGRDGVATLQVLDAVVESAATGRPADLPGATASRPRLEVRPPP
jgi:predicted dehydrogenase